MAVKVFSESKYMKFRHGIIVVKDERPGRKKPWLARWYGEYNLQTATKPRYSRSFHRQFDAERFARQVQEELDAGISTENRDITLRELCDKFLKSKQGKKHSTCIGYEQTLAQLQEHFHSNIPIRKIRQEDAELYIQSIGFKNEYHGKKKTDISDSTRDRHLRQLKSLFGKAVEWEYLSKNIFKPISLGKIRVKPWYYLTPDEFKSILLVLDNLPIHPKKAEQDRQRIIRLKAFYMTMYTTGLRFGEAVNCTFTDNINLDEGTIHLFNREGSALTPAFDMKDYEERTIYIPDVTIEALKKLKKIADSPYVFLNKDSWIRVQNKWNRFRTEGITSQWNAKEMMGSATKTFLRYCKKAGIQTVKKLNLHCLRKSYGTNMARLVTPPETLQEWMGHSSSSVTMKYYVQNLDENKKKALENLNNLLSQ